MKHKYANTRKKFAVERNRFVKAQDEYMNTIKSMCPYLRREAANQEDFDKMEQAWRTMQDIAPLVHTYHDELNMLDEMLELSSFGKNDDLYTISRPLSEVTGGSNGLEILVDPPHEHDAGSILPDFADQYYEHASAVRYLSDDLINLGPRPSVQDEPNSTRDADLRGTTSYSRITTAAYEYAERHLEILKDLEFERAEAARYKQLCQEHNIQLERETEADVDNQSENVYHSLLTELEHGPSRLESIVAVNQGQQQYSTNMPTSQAETTQDSRIAQWASSVASQSGRLVSEPFSMIDDVEYRVREERFHRRRPSRRRSVSPLLPGRDTTDIVTRSHEALCRTPPRSDSGYFII
jgi:hypothetical protein